VGFRSDVERARLLDTSLQLQCAQAHAQWYKENKAKLAWMNRGLLYRTRRDFVFGFAQGVGMKLASARAAAVQEAAAHEAERSETSVDEATQSVALVLVNRTKRVDEFYDEVWGGRVRSSTSRYSAGVGGRTSGVEAGQRANTNTAAGSLRGPRGAIGS
jgi:hypothetical protein